MNAGFLPKIQGIDFITDKSYVVASLLYDACVNFAFMSIFMANIVLLIRLITLPIILSHHIYPLIFINIIKFQKKCNHHLKWKEEQNLNINVFRGMWLGLGCRSIE